MTKLKKKAKDQLKEFTIGMLYIAIITGGRKREKKIDNLMILLTLAKICAAHTVHFTFTIFHNVPLFAVYSSVLAMALCAESFKLIFRIVA